VLFDAFHREMRARQVVLFHFPQRPDGRVAGGEGRSRRWLRGIRWFMTTFTATTSTIHSGLAAHRPSPRTVELQGFALNRSPIPNTRAVLRRTGIAGRLSVILRRPRDAICLSLYRDRR